MVNAEGPVVGVLLAGGRARRMGGGDKCLLDLGGVPVLARVIARVEGQVDTIMLNTNGDPARFAAFGVATAADGVGGFAGPLAGVLSGMEWALRHVPGARWIASFPTDTPFLPLDLVARMRAAVSAEGAELATVFSGSRAQPVFGLWPVDMAADLRRGLAVDGVRKVDKWTRRWRRAAVVYDAGDGGVADPFFNINRPEDLDLARQALVSGASGPAARC